MSETPPENSHKDTEPRQFRVRFGPKPHQTMPREWSESMLDELRKINPALFGKLLRHAAIGDGE